MKKIRNFLICLILMAITVTALSWWIRVTPVTVPAEIPDWYQAQRLGGYHIHTAASHDSEGTMEELFAAAKSNNLSFTIITDHNALSFIDPYKKNDTLLIAGLENSTSFGHMVTLKNSRVLEGQEKDNPLVAAHQLGTLAIAAHPTALKGSWRSNDFSQFDGLEIASKSSDFYRLLLPTNWGKALLAIPAMWLFPNSATALTTIYDERSWAIFDQELAKGHQMLPFCGLDAHRHLPYEWEFSTYQLVSLDKWYFLENEKIEQAALLKSLELGDYYCRVGYLGDIRLDFKANTLIAYRQGGRVNTNLVRSFTAEVFPTPAYPLEFRLYKNGRIIATQNDKLETAPQGPGGYRLEVWAKLPGVFSDKMVPLFYSTSIVLD